MKLYLHNQVARQRFAEMADGTWFSFPAAANGWTSRRVVPAPNRVYRHNYEPLASIHVRGWMLDYFGIPEDQHEIIQANARQIEVA